MQEQQTKILKKWITLNREILSEEWLSPPDDASVYYGGQLSIVQLNNYKLLIA